MLDLSVVKQVSIKPLILMLSHQAFTYVISVSHQTFAYEISVSHARGALPENPKRGPNRSGYVMIFYTTYNR